MLHRKTPPPFHPSSCRRLYVRHWMAPGLVPPRALSIETGCETLFATMVPIAPPRILPRARAAQTSTLTQGGRSSARRILALDRHLRETRGGKSHTQDKWSASCTHAYTHPETKTHHCKQISNSTRSDQIQSNSIEYHFCPEFGYYNCSRRR